jgi:cytochrome P450 family 709
VINETVGSCCSGKVFLTWSGLTTPALFVGRYDMVKRVLFDKTGLYGKTDPGPIILSLLGRGLVFSDGEYWSRHRRVVHPAFAMDKLKSMTGSMVACAAEVIRAWEALAVARGEEEVTVEVAQQFTELTADVISHTAFGSSYRQGKAAFLAQRELQSIAFASLNSARVPGMQYLPTKANARRWQLERTVRGTLMAIIDERLAAAHEARGYGSDLLGLMLEANNGGGDGKSPQQAMSMDEIIEECKTFFFAGHNTTSQLLAWATFLLGTHPEWQQRLREEVIRECGGAEVLLHGDALNKLKLVSLLDTP